MRTITKHLGAKNNWLAAETTQQAMGTVITHRVYGVYAQAGLAAVLEEIIHLEKLFSRFLLDSDISRINQSAGITQERISPETHEILTQAIEFSHMSQGRFDITIEPLTHLWNQMSNSNSSPDKTRIEHLLPLVNYSDIILDPWQMTAGLRYAGQSIDLGAIGKGFAGNAILKIYKKFEISSAITNLGGNVVVSGSKPDGSPWMVGIQHPRDESAIIGAVAVTDCNVVTSGDYQRFFIDGNGVRQHHIIDPLTGYPACSHLMSVTTIAEDSIVSDVLSTTLFIVGMQAGLELLRFFPQVEAIFIDTDMNVFITPGLEKIFFAEQEVNITTI